MLRFSALWRVKKKVFEPHSASRSGGVARKQMIKNYIFSGHRRYATADVQNIETLVHSRVK